MSEMFNQLLKRWSSIKVCWLVYWFWFKNRATYTTDGFIDASTNKHFYAGYDIDYSAIFKYTIDRENGTVTIDSFNWEETYYVSLTELFIPRTIELYPVTK